MMKKISVYWWCQILGWGTFFLISSFFYYTIRTKPLPNFFPSLLIEISTGLIITHLMRWIIIKAGFLSYSLQIQVRYFLITTLLFAFTWACLSVSLVSFLKWESQRLKSFSFLNKVTVTSVNAVTFLLIWNLLYFTYHYIVKSRTEQLDKIRLESLVKELELKTIKAHINPHFIFNALNSIRALVDENPQRARTAITELSNILRSSMQANKMETTSLEKELNIVRDYLALEYIRFEERLQVEYAIDEHTLDQQVPPMMLQTLVENAIKHGISKQLTGGTIKIISNFKETHHELIVQNTGHLNGSVNSSGFGLESTQNRLKLLYGSQASFNIYDVHENVVEARVIIPVETT